LDPAQSLALTLHKTTAMVLDGLAD